MTHGLPWYSHREGNRKLWPTKTSLYCGERKPHMDVGRKGCLVVRKGHAPIEYVHGGGGGFLSERAKYFYIVGGRRKKKKGNK